MIQDEIKVGLIGLDTSHAVAFTKLLNEPDSPAHVPGARVVAAVKTCSPDIEASRGRVEGYAATLRDAYGVQMRESIEHLCHEVDAVMIVSLDGRAHLEQAKRVLAAGRRVFVDKPMAASYRDVVELFRLSNEAGVPVFSSSAYRFYPSLLRLKEAKVGEVRSAISYGPAYLEPHHPDLFFYGIHPAEALYAVMGSGCESVVRAHTADSDVVTGHWVGGRVGILHGLRTSAIPHKVTVFGSEGFAEQMPTDMGFSQFGAMDRGDTAPGGDNYGALLREIVAFLRGGAAPVSPEETMELFAFLEAAEECKRRGGAPVLLNEIRGG